MSPAQCKVRSNESGLTVDLNEYDRTTEDKSLRKSEVFTAMVLLICLYYLKWWPFKRNCCVIVSF